MGKCVNWEQGRGKIGRGLLIQKEEKEARGEQGGGGEEHNRLHSQICNKYANLRNVAERKFREWDCWHRGKLKSCVCCLNWGEEVPEGCFLNQRVGRPHLTCELHQRSGEAQRSLSTLLGSHSSDEYMHH